MSFDDIKRFVGQGVFPHKFAFTLLIPLRNIVFSPKTLIERLQLQDDLIVLELGPGPGYFSVEVARHVPKGKLYLADIQQEMLNYAKKRLDKRNIKNVEYALCDGITLPYADNKFDVVFMVTVLGEVDNKEQYVKELYRIMRMNGILSITEIAGDADKMSIKDIENLFNGSGFEIDKFYGNRKTFTINFRKVQA